MGNRSEGGNYRNRDKTILWTEQPEARNPALPENLSDRHIRGNRGHQLDAGGARRSRNG